MATIKHTSSKNSDLSAAERYLTFQHNEYTGLPILDDYSQPKLRENYLLDTLECGENTFAMAQPTETPRKLLVGYAGMWREHLRHGLPVGEPEVRQKRAAW